MDIREILNLLEQYRQSIAETRYRDEQLRHGSITFREKGNEAEFYALSKIEGLVKISAYTCEIESRDPQADPVSVFADRDLERYTPIRILSAGYFPVILPADAYEDAILRARENVKKKEKEQALVPRREGDPVRPAYTGDKEHFAFITKNNIEYQVFSPKAFRNLNESRRFFKRSYLPYADGEYARTAPYFLETIHEGDFLRYGGNLTSAVISARTVLKEVLPLAEKMTDLCEKDRKYYL